MCFSLYAWPMIPCQIIYKLYYENIQASHLEKRVHVECNDDNHEERNASNTPSNTHFSTHSL